MQRDGPRKGTIVREGGEEERERERERERNDGFNDKA
jgi:hypothetical protein